MDFSSMSNDEVFALARAANVEVYTRALPIAQQVARGYVNKYDWISAEDLTQNLMFEIPAIMYRYRDDNKQGIVWSKFLYYKLLFKAKDYLRKEDPVGIKWPQKKAYPKWHRLGDECLDGYEPVDGRCGLSDVEKTELKDEIDEWRSFFAELKTSKRKAAKIPYWDATRNRVKFCPRKSLTLAEWCLDRRCPKQMALEFDC